MSRKGHATMLFVFFASLWMVGRTALLLRYPPMIGIEIVHWRHIDERT